MDQQLETLQKVQEVAIESAVSYGPKVLVALVILLIGVYVGRWVGRATEKALLKLELEPPVRQLLSRIVQILVLGLFAVMALQNIGVELLPLIAGVGVVGAGIALAMQGVLGNLAAGLTIIFTRPFRVGEFVSLLGEEGEVEIITLFNTVLGHPDLSRVVIPNRMIVGEIMHNYGRIRQLNVVVGVAYDTDLNKALAAVDKVLSANPKVLKDPAPLIHVTTLADSSINITVSPWVEVTDYVHAPGEINKAIVEAFRANEINIPFPQREVRLLGNAA
ncbi:MAG: mechanosensitive ion channel family protein [Betaproteobacteria bacterium]|nr:MAG: mechanosensitive ion channel family protein [Betaproteobacteria bacterium]